MNLVLAAAMSLLFLIIMCGFATGLQCWTCENARSFGACVRSGRLRTCHNNQGTCQTEVRRDSGGLRITKRCKQNLACYNDARNANCVYPRMNSVCRCCCAFDRCNKERNSCQKRRRVHDYQERRVKKCDLLPAPEFGTKHCTKNPENLIGSRCKFSCNQNYELVGSRASQCVFQRSSNTARFDRAAPVCQPRTCQQQLLEHGSINCTNGNRIGSHCEFTCDQENGYELIPSDFGGNTCLSGSAWSIPTPCCSHQCPKYALVDLVIAMDSSSSIGKNNWKTMKDFVFNLTKKFTIGQDTARISVFRYNQDVDSDSQILLNSANETREFHNAFGLLHYDGRGTMIGGALRYVQREILQETNGDRRNVPDVVLTISDGASQDDVVAPSQQLRDQHVLTYALGINSARGSLNRDQLLEVAGSSDNYLEAGHGFADLDLAFVEKLSKKLCEFRCQQSAPDEI